jgi:hypothetical protein
MLHMPPDLAGTWIPEIWSAQTIEDLEASLILASPTVTNRAYEGSFAHAGDTIRIPHFLADPTIQTTGEAYGEIGEADKLGVDALTMRIDQWRSWHFEVDSLHQLRTAAGINYMESALREYAKATAQSMDKHVALTIVDAITAKDRNNGGATLHGFIKAFPAPGASTLYDTLVDMRTQLDIDNVPTSGRYILLGPREYAIILKDERFIDASKYGAGSVVVNGEVGRILGMPVLVSNTVGAHLGETTPNKKFVRKPHDGANGIHVIVGHNMAVSFAGQLSELEPYRPEKKFTDAVKARFIFGTKVIRPEAMVIAGTLVNA